MRARYPRAGRWWWKPGYTWAKVLALLFACFVPIPVLGALPYPPELRRHVEFWKKIFAEYRRSQVVIHDSRVPERIYSVLDFSADAEELGSDILPAYIEIRIGQEKERIRKMLMRLHENGGVPEPWNEEAKRIAALFRHEKRPDKFLVAADPARIRAQRGLREKFAEGLRIAGRYLPAMEAIFRERGLPVELTRLPLIESCFDVRAYSKAGAAGIWQFIPETGKLFLRIDEAIDERRDPIASTRAAALFLERNYRKLGTWPLAVTAYNHGPAGVQQAVATVGTTDLVEIIRRYEGPRFGFASRNFYAELLAAIEVEREQERYFGTLRRLAPLATEEVRVSESIPFALVARLAGVSREDLAELNLALTPKVTRGDLPVPAGFRLRLPLGQKNTFEIRYAAWRLEAAQRVRVASARRQERRERSRKAVLARASAQRTEKRIHRVRPGQTLTTIARLYGRSVGELERENGLRRGTKLKVGQVLVIPKS